MSLKLTKPQGNFLFLILLCAGLTCVIALALVFVRSGFHSVLVHEWMKDWVIAFAVALPASLIITPLARRLAAALTQ
ncbi:hypothetical protein BH11PLA1_BH11PLA1_14740 [soil metagenome]